MVAAYRYIYRADTDMQTSLFVLSVKVFTFLPFWTGDTMYSW